MQSQHLELQQTIIIPISREIKKELVRKAIHFLIALVPLLSSLLGSMPTLAILAGGVLTYTYAEWKRGQGVTIPFISRITLYASRERDTGHFVLGPVTLGLGAMIALMLYPEPAASVAIYALAFGDGVASVIGKLFGRIKLPASGGKTVEGSLACFLAVLLASYTVVHNLPGAIALAFGAALLEAAPTEDLDNLILPTGVGFLALLIL
ncbi:MAG: diacylglycerol/polyprenol kinase family protein [Alkalispirochaetaceae bacterium]